VSVTARTPVAAVRSGDAYALVDRAAVPFQQVRKVPAGLPLVQAGSASGEAALKPEDYPCPEVTVRPGAGTLLLGSKSSVGEIGAMDLRYQGTLVRFARECIPKAGIMTMKIGIEGRVITGPAGGPGTVDIPLRIAVVQEGINPKTITSKFARIQVGIAGAVDRVPFTHVDPDVSFPMPTRAADIDSYVVYVGFDPVGAQQDKKKPAPKSKPKPKSAAKPRQS